VSKITLLSAILTIVYSCQSVNHVADCQRFQRGKFILYSEFGGGQSIIQRADSLQIELDNRSGNVIRLRIKWLSDCEYQTTFINQTVDSTSQNWIPTYLQTHTLTTKILSTTKDYCLFESSMDGVSKKLVDTLFLYETIGHDNNAQH
jgi:hypothetical protein